VPYVAASKSSAVPEPTVATIVPPAAAPSGNAVAADAAEGEGGHLGDGPRGEAQTDLRRAPAEVEDRERDGDRGEIRPDVGDRPGGEEKPEVPVAERLHDWMVVD
jgi:hypothetical protein